MNRILASLALALFLGSAAATTVRADAAADRAALQAELDALRGELEQSVEEEVDPLLKGAVPDLVLLSSTEVRGEYTPCG